MASRWGRKGASSWMGWVRVVGVKDTGEVVRQRSCQNKSMERVYDCDWECV